MNKPFPVVLILLLGLLAPPLFAQNADPEPEPISEDDSALPYVQRDFPTSGFSPEGPGASTIAPPEAHDSLFVTTGLSAGCRFHSSGVIEFDIYTTRYVGEVDAEGHLTKLPTMMLWNVADLYAILKMPIYDVDSEAQVEPPLRPEMDTIEVNGIDVGTLPVPSPTPLRPIVTRNNRYAKGINNTWVMNTFTIPLYVLKFPARATPGNEPTPVPNRVRITVDTGNNNAAVSNGDIWCLDLDWASLEILCMSPLVLMHGNSQDGGWYDRHHFTDELKHRAYPYDNSISLVPSANAVTVNGLKLAYGDSVGGSKSFRDIAKSFGVDSIHIVAHSKGGLDTREYLALYQKEAEDDFSVLSLTTLSTPHNGSVLADNQVLYNALAKFWQDEYWGGSFPTFSESLSWLNETNAGYPDLQIDACAGFNRRNVPALDKKRYYRTISADMDKNGNGIIDDDAEVSEISIDMGTTAYHWACNAVYQIVRNVKRIEIKHTPGTVYDDLGFLGVPTTTPQLNDILVSINSGSGKSGIFPIPFTGFDSLTKDTYNFTGTAGKNHSSIGGLASAFKVLDKLPDAERASKRGDIK